MPYVPRRRGWEIPGSEATPEAAFWNRREFLRSLGLAGAGALVGGGALVRAARAAGTGSGVATSAATKAAMGAASGPAAPTGKASPARYPARHNPKFVLDRPLTVEQVAAHHNNFYEFTEEKSMVWRMVDAFEPRPWTIQVRGMVERPIDIDVDALLRKLPAEERLYRHRCVEAWAMAVPWTGIPMREFVRWAKPLSSAKYVRMVSFKRPEQAPGQKHSFWYKWPYYEALSMPEATNELALLAFGIYGHDLPKQHGAPIRLVTPWKYGFKSIKSITMFEFTDRQPATFWNDVAPAEYDFNALVNPRVPHPRWSQATETMIGTGEKRPTQLFNGYGEFVAGLYPGM